MVMLCDDLYMNIYTVQITGRGSFFLKKTALL